MARNYSGYFITLEGGEGVGKTSLLPIIASTLQDRGLNITAIREPGGTSIGEQIRDVLHKRDNIEMHPRCETLLYQSSRAQIVEEIILPRLKEGGIVLSDRFADSTLAYQGYGHKQDLNRIKTVVEYATGGLKPDLTLLLDLDTELGLERKLVKNCEMNRMDLLPPDFYKRVRTGFLNMAEEEPDRWVVIDAAKSPQEVFDNSMAVIEGKLASAGIIESELRGAER